LASIPGLEDVTVSTPAPSGAAAAQAAGSAPPPASDAPQPAAEAQVIRAHFRTKYTWHWCEIFVINTKSMLEYSYDRFHSKFMSN